MRATMIDKRAARIASWTIVVALALVGFLVGYVIFLFWLFEHGHESIGLSILSATLVFPTLVMIWIGIYKLEKGE